MAGSQLRYLDLVAVKVMDSEPWESTFNLNHPPHVEEEMKVAYLSPKAMADYANDAPFEIVDHLDGTSPVLAPPPPPPPTSRLA